MPWARFDDQYPDHPKIIEVGPLGMALHTAAICYCARYLTDGFISESMINRLINFDGIQVNSNAVTNKQITAELTKANLLEIVPGGFMVHDYLDYNPNGDQIKAEKAANRARQKTWRDTHRKKDGKFTHNANNNAVSNDIVTPAPSPSPSLIKDLLLQDVGDPAGKVFSAYHQNIGALTKMISERIDLLIVDYSSEWVIAAIEESTRMEKRSLAYVEGILKRWKQEGFKSDYRSLNKPANPDKSNGGHSRPVVESERDKMLRLLQEEE